MNKEKIKRKLITILFVCIGMLCFGLLAGVKADNRVQMRTTINNESPLLLSPLYGNDNGNGLWWGNTLKGAWEAIPEDVKPYAAIELHPAKVCKPTSCIPRDTKELREWYVKMLEEAQSLNIPVFLVIMSAGERNTVPPEWLDEQFQKYSVLKGVLNIENYWIYNNQLAPHSAKYLEVCAKYGAHFIWHDHEKWFWETIMNDPTFFEASQKYHKNLVLATKNTPIRDDAGTDSIVSGFWLSGLCDNWGSSTDTWKWWEKHYTNTFETGRARDMRSYASEPESMIAMEMMNVYTGGGTVYNFECAAYTFMTNDVPTPAFTKGIIPFFRHAIQNPAPSKEEVVNRTKAVFWNGEGRISSLNGFYQGLYSNDETMPLYTNGRYHILPVIHEKIDKEKISSIFPNAKILTKNSEELSSKVNYLNSLYPKLYEGDGYAQRVGNSWYIYNSNANINKNQQVMLPMYTNNTKSLSLDLTPHTYAVVKENPNNLHILLNNYRTDKTAMWALSGNFDASKSWKKEELELANWISKNYSINPVDNDFRTTTLTLKGHTGHKPQINISGDKNHYTYTENWDENTHVYTITVNHNGMVEMSINTEGTGPVPFPTPDKFNDGNLNIAYAKPTTQSSVDYNGDPNRAVDGNRNGNFNSGSVTHTRADNPSWWEVDLKKMDKVGLVKIYNRTDAETQRLSNFDVILYDNNRNEVAKKHVNNLSGESVSLDFKEKGARYIKVKLLTSGVPLSLAEVEVFRESDGKQSEEDIDKITEDKVVSTNKVATQSSTNYEGVAALAVDGNKDGDYGHHSVTHTKADSNAWWQVDLGEEFTVSKVDIYNRTDAEPQRLSNFDVIFVSSSGEEVFRRHFDKVVDGLLSLKVPSVGAKLVKIELKSAAIPLSLAEVEVYGSKRTPKKLSNIALTKETRQSSTDYNGFSRLAVDGNKNGDYGHHSVTHTKGDSPSWWEIDLAQTEELEKLIIYNRTDAEIQRLSNFDIIIYDSNNHEVFKQHIDSLESNNLSIDLKGLKGKKVRISLRNAGIPLSLAEVEVYTYK
ncbi:glycosyl hydrolase family 98 C-terminal domain-containing protein [Streptococcus pneumoniae]|nr:glycosyl hydrolase family 98 C-terminal domain-containing protein [Streptococcus pneumoniae]